VFSVLNGDYRIPFTKVNFQKAGVSRRLLFIEVEEEVKYFRPVVLAVALILAVIIPTPAPESAARNTNNLIAVNPASATITTGSSYAFTVTSLDGKSGSLNDITGSVSFSIDKKAGGYWAGNVYHSENSGTWEVKAKYGNITSTAVITVNDPVLPATPEIQTPPVSEPPGVLSDPPSLPPAPEATIPAGILQPIEGSFYGQYNQVAEFGDTFAFAYDRNGTPMVHIQSGSGPSDHALPGVSGFWMYTVKTILTSETELWVAYGVPIKINRYLITDNGLQLQQQQAIGDSYSRLKGLIKLESGKLLVAWYQHQKATDTAGNSGVNVGFAYFDQVWTELPYTFVYPNATPTNATICQHPGDDSIWWFSVHDGNHHVKAIRLTDDQNGVRVTGTDYDFIDNEDAIAPEGEFPWICSVADPINNTILIAFQNANRYWFSYDPFVKGAFTNIVTVSESGQANLLTEVQYYTERCIPLLLGVSDGSPWLSYGAINERDLDWNHLSVFSEGQNIEIGELVNGTPSNQFISVCNSSKWIIAEMSDGLIHLFPI
jgi:hypothetical protein